MLLPFKSKPRSYLHPSYVETSIERALIILIFIFHVCVDPGGRVFFFSMRSTLQAVALSVVDDNVRQGAMKFASAEWLCKFSLRATSST